MPPVPPPGEPAPKSPPWWRSSIAGLVLISVLASTASILTRDPAGNLPRLPAGPGLTLDEVYNVEMGMYLVRSVRIYGLGVLAWESIKEIFGARAYNPDHPPLGRVAMGVVHDTVQAVRGRPPTDYVTADARMAPALAFGLTIFLVGWFTSRWCGARAGWLAALSLALIPRLFGHSHIASLETFVGLTYSATILYVADAWSRPLVAPVSGKAAKVSTRAAVFAGILFGLALLTKIQGALAAVPVGLWGLWHFRHRAILPGAAFGLVGFLTFFVGWPWLWLNPVAHVIDFFARSTDRQVLYCYYEGTKFADIDVPWHYPFVIFAITVPLGLHVAAVLGLVGKSSPSVESLPAAPLRDPRLQLVLTAILFPLVLFAKPGIAVYDGERLFLIIYPLWGVFIGRGAAVIWAWLERRFSSAHRAAVPSGSPTGVSAPSRSRLAAVAMAGFLAAQTAGYWTVWPFLLSHYNVAVGGLWGANRLGFERSYWGESINRTFLEEIVRNVPEGATIHVAPVLHPLQLSDLEAQSPILRRHGVHLASFDDRIRSEVRYVVVHRRMADPWETLREDRAAANGFRLVAEVRREGVQLAALYASEVSDPSKSP